MKIKKMKVFSLSILISFGVLFFYVNSSDDSDSSSYDSTSDNSSSDSTSSSSSQSVQSPAVNFAMTANSSSSSSKNSIDQSHNSALASSSNIVDDSRSVVSGIGYGNSVVNGAVHEDVVEKEEEIEMEGIDTLEIKSGGNWYNKRVWWLKTEEDYEEIKKVFGSVLNSRISFFDKRNEIDSKLDSFYTSIGLEQAPLQDILSYIKDLMEHEKKQQGGTLSEKERKIIEKVKSKERELDQLKIELKAVESGEDKLNAALKTLLEQVDICNQYENRAWDNFKDIARELDDKEARKKYYDTHGLLDDINKVLTYIKGDFNNYFSQLITSIEDSVKKASVHIHTMKIEGIDLKKTADDLAKADDNEVELKKIEKIKKEEAEKLSHQTIKKEIEKKTKTVFEYIGDFLYSFGKILNSGYEYFCSLFFKKSSSSSLKTEEKIEFKKDDVITFEKPKDIENESPKIVFN